MICSNHVDVSEDVRACTRCRRAFCPDCLVTIQGQPFCATCKSEKLLDIQSGSDASTLRFATLSRRLAAQWIDGFLFAIPAVVIFGAIAFFAVQDQGEPSAILVIGLVVAGMVFLFGFVAYEALMLASRGQTLGKILMRIRVVRPDGSPISTGQAWGRALTRAVMVHMLALVNYLPAFFTAEKTCVHDMAAKTRVVSAD
jgi:uncharacterized RDD family membrane protein YckC